MNKQLTLSLCAAAALSLAAHPGCKNAEKKSATATKPAEESGGEGGERAAPQPQPQNPNQGDPHAGMGMPNSPQGAAMGGGGLEVSSTGEDGTKTMGPLELKVPQAWQESEPSSSMRVAQFTVPGEAGPAELVVYYFGGGGGSIEANLDRWYGQFQQPDGSPSKAKAERKDREIGGFDVTTVDVSGRYVAAVRPGAPAKHDKPDHQMLAAIVQTDRGPIFFKMVGPKKTVTAAKKDWEAMIQSFSKAG